MIGAGWGARGRSLAATAATVVLLASCGARLTAEQRAAGIGSLRGGTGGDTTGASTGNTFGSGTGGTTGGTGAAGTGTAGAGTGGLGAAGCTGTGGATDKGVTANQITLATASDISGVQPGLFKSTWQAMEALAAYANSQGGVCGRGIKNLLLDSQASSTADRAAVQQACDQSFALVGSMSAFDDGGASAGQDCGIPDISAITVNQARSDATNVYPAYPVGPHHFATGWGLYIKNTYPEAVQTACFVTLNVGVSVQNGQQRINALTKLGYRFVWTGQTQVVQANYTPFVQQMKDHDCHFIDMLADYQSMVRFQQAMQQQNWYPQIRVWDSAAYSPAYLTQGGSAVNSVTGVACSVNPQPCPSYVFINTSLFEEASSNPELQLYETWLQRVAPGAQPDYFGEYAWSAGRLFIKAAAAVGAHLTRSALLAELKTIHAWNDFGMHATHDIGNKLEANCYLYVETVNDRFVRKTPASGWTCAGPLMNT